MENFKILSKEQVFGDNALDILKKEGNDACITDFAILLGGHSRPTVNPVAKDGLKEMIGSYWLDEKVTHGNIKTNYCGFQYSNAISSRKIGIRLAKDITSIYDVPSNNGENVYKDDGFYKVEYGYCPQSAVSEKEQESLNKVFKRNIMIKTGNRYTIDSVSKNIYADKFAPQTLEEYEYLNNRYVRVLVNSGYKESIASLSNGEEYAAGEYVWVKVEPIKWWIDENEKIMVTEKIISSGVQFSNLWGINNYEESFLKEYINTYLEKEFFQEKWQK